MYINYASSSLNCITNVIILLKELTINRRSNSLCAFTVITISFRASKIRNQILELPPFIIGKIRPQVIIKGMTSDVNHGVQNTATTKAKPRVPQTLLYAILFDNYFTTIKRNNYNNNLSELIVHCTYTIITGKTRRILRNCHISIINFRSTQH